MLKKKIIGLVLFFTLISLVYAEPWPVLYGQGLDGLDFVDGSIVTIYPQRNESDTITDIVGLTGKTNVSGYWKVNLNNLNTELTNGDIIVIHMSDGENETIRYFTLTDGSLFTLDLNYDPEYQDYDGDGHFAANECDDNNAAKFPGNSEICGDGIDQDCSGGDSACPASTSGGGSSRGRGGGSTVVVCEPDWQCAEWTECNSENIKECLLWVDNNNCYSDYDGSNTEPCEYQPEEATEETIPKEQQSPEEEVEFILPETEGLPGITGQVIDRLGQPSTITVLLLIGVLLALLFIRRKKTEAF